MEKAIIKTSPPQTKSASPTNTNTNTNINSSGQTKTPPKYWRQPPSKSGQDDIVVIHVSDENRNISKDFCCKRDILVRHMKYFESFLAENENGYDDIDISVHCDVEIFEWLMSYIHEPNAPPNLDKSMVVSILISSEFLQMDILVDLCLQHISNNLTEIIKLPIDLSCISEKLINKLAFITSPKVKNNKYNKFLSFFHYYYLLYTTLYYIVLYYTIVVIRIQRSQR